MHVEVPDFVAVVIEAFEIAAAGEDEDVLTVG